MDAHDIHQTLVQSGQRQQISEFLRSALTECGWRDQVRQQITAIIETQGIQHTTIDSIYSQVLPKSMVMIPDSIKDQLYVKMERAAKLSSSISDSSSISRNDQSISSAANLDTKLNESNKKYRPMPSSINKSEDSI